MMYKRLFWAMVVAVGVTGCVATAQERHQDSDHTVLVKDDDSAMAAAIAKAQSTLDDFLAKAASPAAGTSEYQLKVRVSDANGTEHFWVAPFEVDGTALVGTIANEPEVVKSVALGQVIRFTRDDVSDWGYVKDGKRLGNFTTCALFAQMPKKEVDYYVREYGFQCE